LRTQFLDKVGDYGFIARLLFDNFPRIGWIWSAIRKWAKPLNLEASHLKLRLCAPWSG